MTTKTTKTTKAAAKKPAAKKGTPKAKAATESKAVAVTTVNVAKDGYPTSLAQAGKRVAHTIEQADKSLHKYDDYMATAAATLVQARDECKATKGVSFTKWMADHGIGKTRAYQVLAVADGTMTKDELLAKNAAEQRAYQKKLKAKAAKAAEAEEEGDDSASPSKASSKSADSSHGGRLDVSDFADFCIKAMQNNNEAKARKAIEDELIAICNEFDIDY